MSEQTSLALDIQNLTVEFHTMDDVVHAVNGLDLSIKKGQTLGLVGETGAGDALSGIGKGGSQWRKTGRSGFGETR